MSTEQIAAICGAALGAGGLGAFLTYLAARRRTSGQVATTDADRLWAQNDKLIETLRTDNSDLRARLGIVDGRMLALENANRECMRREEVLTARLQAAEDMLRAKTGEAEAIMERAVAQTVVAEQQTKIAELRQKNGGAL